MIHLPKIRIQAPEHSAIHWTDAYEGTYQGHTFYILGGQPEAGYIDLLLNGKRIRVSWSLQVEKLLDQVQLPSRRTAQERALRAPMPGLIREIRVKLGQRVTPQTPVIVIEAMKMENLLYAPSEGIVESIPVHPGSTVEKGALLMQLAP